MANNLDELEDVASSNRDVRVINKTLPVKVGAGSVIFEVILWILGIIPGLIFLFCKINAASYLRKLEQQLQRDASQVDNYLEQRVVILQNASKLLEKSINLDKETFTEIAALRSGSIKDDNSRQMLASQVDKVNAKLNLAFENYPDLKSQNQIADLLQQNAYLQREITSARELYNDTVNRWNQSIQSWPAKMIVAARRGYTTRIPFTTTDEVRNKAREVLF